MSETGIEGIDVWVRYVTFAPLIVCSVCGVALIISKWLDLRRRRVTIGETLANVLALLRTGDEEKALKAAEADPSYAAQLVSTLIRHSGRSRESMLARAAHAGQETSRDIQGGLGGLALIAVLGPLFGLLGTVVGIVVVFQVLAMSEGGTSPQQLAGGIGTALYTTIAGLALGITALVCHRALSARVDRIMHEIETIGLDVVDLLTGEPT